MADGKVLRAGSAPKRAAILTAARELFLSVGFDRSSVDAVAARAGVSKRTVYDYFGDKQTLLQAVVDTAGRATMATIERTLDETLAGVTEPAELEDALVTFAMRISTEMLGSAEYATLARLALADSRPRGAQVDSQLITNAPEEAVAARFAALGRAGLLEVPDPRLAADHFVALTFGVALNRLGAADLTRDERVHPLVVEGARVFLRAYRAAS
ncbi:TetR/AcrR family transcriptional regulator [Actinophytocola xanthii]|uniref:TetR family transcriptional regulator n=1 Tax=Actinophytocola xanthii TaxID=1912961 RepID=A0A1Q8CQH7_9PSEU|nr:TetR/AcrR family transcriptional regulator [Actinophytocola xanthii]OLF16613.1 TetR family transcriptional regulator [Actinophytocola xanthii]